MTQLNPTRRDVLAAMATIPAAAALAAAADSTHTPGAAMEQEFYELRELHLRRGPMAKRLDEYLQNAMIPAARRAGTGPIGVFNVTIGIGNPTVHIVIPHPNIESFLTLAHKLHDDAEYIKASADYRALPATDPPYVLQQIQLLRAFPHFPKLELPEAKSRIVELRTYRSHSRSAGAKKIEMFDTGGEIGIFRRVGLQPVFFAETLVGPSVPSLTYMLTYPDLATREKNWKAFATDPEWNKLKTTPGFTDAEIVVDINNQILAPTAYSQI